MALFDSGEGEEDFDEDRVEDICGELLQVAVEGVGDEEVQDWSRQQGEGGVKGQAKRNREIVWACSEMPELGEGDVMEKLDKELAGNVLLVRGESLNSNEDGGGGDEKDVEGVNVEGWK